MGSLPNWLRSEGVLLAVMISTGLLGAMAVVAWPAVGGTWLLILLGVGVVLSIVITVDEGEGEGEAEGFGGPLWGQDGRRWSMSESEFESLVREVENSAALTDLDAADSGEPEERAFAAIVREAIEDLPAFVKAELARNVAVIVADDGASPQRYGHPNLGGLFGLYVGWTASAPTEGARIILFRDTLTSTFDDPNELREQLAITLRHEIAHHLGADEKRVEELGL